MSFDQPLVPILLNGFGRSGSTAIMAILGTNPQVAFDRTYPFETRCLSYIARSALLAGRRAVADHFEQVQLFEFETNNFGAPPFPDGLAVGPMTDDWLASLTQLYYSKLQRNRPEAKFYAEKAPPWLAPMLRRIGAVKVIHLIRDPRDTFLSASAFRESTGALGFGRADQSVVQQSRQIIRGWLGACENERADRGRPDSLVVRYEDWVTNPEKVVASLNGFLGIELNASAPELTKNLSRHQTSKKLSDSVERWRREPLPDNIAWEIPALTRSFLDDYRYVRPANLPRLNFEIDPAWETSTDGKWSRTSEGLEISISGSDAHIHLPRIQMEARPDAEIWLCLRGDTGDHHAAYWSGPGRDFGPRREVRVPFQPSDHWQIVALPLGQNPRWHGSINEMRLDLFNGAVQSGGRGIVRWVRCMGLDELTQTSSAR